MHISFQALFALRWESSTIIVYAIMYAIVHSQRAQGSRDSVLASFLGKGLWARTSARTYITGICRNNHEVSPARLFFDPLSWKTFN